MPDLEIYKTFLEKSVSSLASNDLQAALQAASDACHSAEHQPQCHYVYGQVWLALGEASRAERAFAAAIQLAPHWADAWINYGLARYRQGKIEDAKTAVQQALLAAPGHPAATANLAAFMRITGQSEKAELLLRDVLAREPKNIGARLNLVAELLQGESAAEALVLLDQEPPSSSDQHTWQHWYLQRALALLQLRRVAEARQTLDAFASAGNCLPELAPLWHWRLVLLALAENNVSGATAEAEQMEAAIASSAALVLLEHNIMAHFDLAKFWSGLNNHSRAFDHWIEGHKLLKSSQPFSRPEYTAFVDSAIAAFDAARFENGPRANNADPSPVFIVGMPRSGTTLVEQILAAHPDVHAAGERAALAQIFAALGGGGPDASGRIAKLDGNSLNSAADGYLAELHALAPDKTRIVDKMPGNFNYLGLVGLLFPRARIIHCARDPRDIGLSIFTFRFHGYHGYAHDLADLGWYIGQHARLMSHWRDALPNPLTVELKDWVHDFTGTLRRVLAFLELPYDSACERFYERADRVRTVSFAQVRQPVNARGLGRWKTYATQLAPLIAQLDVAGLISDDSSDTTRTKADASGATLGESA